jgi:hypothetical protein
MIPRKPEEWLDQIDLAKRYRAAYNREQNWNRNYDWYMGKYDDGIIPVNIVFGIIRGAIPQIYFKAPTILVRPRAGNPQEYQARMQQGKVLEAIDSLLVQHMGLKQTLKVCILDSWLYNVGIMKVGYHSLDTELTPSEGDDSEEILGALEELGLAQSPEPLTDTERLKRAKYSYHDLVRPDHPWVLRVSPKDFVVPVGTRCIEEAPWCAFRIIRRLDEVKLSPVYKNTRTLQGNATLTIMGEYTVIDSPKEKRYAGVGTDDEYVELWEIWDKRSQKVMVVADGHDKYLRDEKHELDLNCLPVEIIQLNPGGDDFWGKSHIDAIAPQVIEYNETRTHEMWNRKAAILRAVADRNLFTPEEIAKIERGDINPVILVSGDPTKAIVFPTVNMSRDIYKVAEDIFSDLRTIIGYNRNQGGDFEQSRRTATEVKTVAQHNFLRDDELRDIVADSLARLFQEKIHPLIFQNWTTKRVVELTSMPPDGTPWVTYDPERVRGDYDVYVVPDSTIPLTKEMEKAETMEVFAALRGDPMIRQDALYRTMIDKFPQFKPEELIKTPQELQQEQMQQLQIQMMLNQSKTQPTEPGQKPSNVRSITEGKK